MSGRAPHPEPSPLEPARESPSRAKLRIVLPIALSVAALAVFLIAFWPDSKTGKNSPARRGHSSERGGSPVGGGSHRETRDEPAGRGNASVTRGGSGGGGPVGGGDSPAHSKAKGETWWYQKKGKASESKGETWWFHEKKEAAGEGAKGYGKDFGKDGEADDVKEDAEETGARERDAVAPRNSGPDKDWWHD